MAHNRSNQKRGFALGRFLALLLMLLPLTAFAQVKVTGTVTDTNGETVIGASVKIKGVKDIGTVTDLEGRYSINAKVGQTLEFSFIGYVTKTAKVPASGRLNVVLSEDVHSLNEVVVVGYGQMKKSDLSGALSQLKGEDMMKGGSLDVAHGMQGKIAGVNIQQSDGAPGGGMSIVVRGTNSFSTSSQPLFIVDGVPFESGNTPSNSATTNEQQSNPLSFINPHDIESIEVLKDASATAIYGSRGANGVVLIQTKKGKAGKPKVEFNATWGWQNIAKKMDMLDPVTYATYINEQNLNDRVYNGSKSTTLPYPGTWGYQYYADGHPNYNTGKYTGSPEDYRYGGWFYDEYGNATQLGTADWQDEIFQNAFQQDYNINVSGGDDRGYYSFSGNYADQDGIIKNSGYKRYALRANISRKVTDWLEVGTNQSFTSSVTDFANTLSFNTGVVRSALLFPPTYGPNMDTTTADDLNWLAANPGAYVRSAIDQLNGSNYFSSSFVQIKFLKNFTFRQNLGLGYNVQDRKSYYGRETQEGKTPINGKASVGHNTWKSLTAESILTYDNTFAKIHHVNVMGAFTIESSNWTNDQQVATNFPDDLTGANDMGRALDKATLSGDKGKQRLASFLGRVNYTLADKYILTASFRSDGSSKFADANKWATFLSGALAWRASEEKFIKDLNIFSNLKFRVSYGETGNQGIGSYRINSQLDTANFPFGGSLSSGAADVSWRGPIDPNIKWETTKQWNAGIDFGWLKNRLTLTVDFYYKKTRDLLQEVIIAPSNGFSNMLTNTGNVTNKGLEITIGATPIDSKDWKWSLNGNIAFNKNSIGGLDGDQFARTLWYGADNIFIQRNGCPIGAIYGYVEDGFYDNIQEVRADPQYTTVNDAVALSKVGEIKYRDLNGDHAITEADRTIIGDTNPDFTFGLTNNISWKNLSLSFLLQGSVGNDIFNGNLMDVTMANIGNIPTEMYNTRWTADNYENAAWPKATGGYNRTFLLSDRYVEDGSYLKLKNISLTYRLPRPIPGIEQVLLSFTATNVFTISNYSWYDPEVNAFGSDSSRRGVDIYSYPSSRTFSFGLGLTF